MTKNNKTKRKNYKPYRSITILLCRSSQEVITKKLTEKWRKFFSEADYEDWASISRLPTGEPMEVKGHAYYSDFHAWRPGDDPDEGGSGDKIVKDNKEVEMTTISPASAPKNESGEVAGASRQLVELPISSSGTIAHGQLATLFVPVRDGQLWQPEGNSVIDTKDGATQTREKHFKNKRDSKTVAFEVNEGFVGEKGGRNMLPQAADSKPLVSLPRVEISNMT